MRITPHWAFTSGGGHCPLHPPLGTGTGKGSLLHDRDGSPCRRGPPAGEHAAKNIGNFTYYFVQHFVGRIPEGLSNGLALLLTVIQLLSGVVLLILRLLGLLSLRGGLTWLLLRLLWLLALLWRLLLRRLKIRIGLTGALRISGCGRVVRRLGTVGRLVPSLLRLLLTAGLAALLGCSLCAGLVD